MEALRERAGSRADQAVTENAEKALNARERLESYADDNTLFLYGDIVESGWESLLPWETFSSAKVRNFLKTREGADVTVRINSYGGLATEGVSIYNLLKDHSGKVTTKVDGICASAATMPFIAGNARVMGGGTQMMIHSPWVMVIGDYQDMRKASDRLEKSAGIYAEVYASASSMDKAEALAAMDEETFYSGAEAVEVGFATEVSDSVTSDEGKDQARHYGREIEMHIREIELSRSKYLRS